MTRFFISALALLGMGTMANAQFSVYDQEGKVLFTMPTTPAYVDFTYNKPITGTENGHDWVDLGLSVKWATMNVGANAPQEYGSYIAWGETEPHYSAGGNTDSPTWKEGYSDGYDWSTYKHMKEGSSNWQDINKYTAADNQTGAIWYKGDNFVGDNKKTLDKSDDAATANWGDNWRMPTAAEWQELNNNTNKLWTSDYNGTGVAGYILTSTVEGHTDASIFLPAAGYRGYSSLHFAGSNGYFWSSSLGENGSGSGRGVYFNSGNFYTNNGNRYYGQSVRPVCPAQ